jgi:pimeloyl-ACP methyl ester carboxylesterase
MTSPTFVFIHGACHGASCWEPLMARLESAGLRCTAVDLPSAGPDRDRLGDLHADAAIVRAATEACASAVVVAHSYGGMPASEAVAGANTVRRLVYLAAFMPAEGQALIDISSGGDGDWIASDDGVTISARDPAWLFYNHCEPAVVAAALAQLVPQALTSFSQPVRHAGWRGTPSTYVVCDDDHAIAPDLQRAMAQQAEQIHTLASDHSPFLSHPDETAALLARIAGDA